MRVLILALLASALLGCSETVLTKRHPGGIGGKDALADNAKGIVYLLPMRLAQLTVQRTPVPDDLEKQITEAQSKLAEAKAAAAKAKADEAAAKKLLDELVKENSDPEAIKQTRTAHAFLVQKSKDAAGAQTTAQKKVDDLEALRDLRNTAAERDPATLQAVSYKLDLILLPTQGDPRQAFVANLNHSEMRDDTITLGTTADGLLTTSNVKAADQTGDILVSLAGILGALGLPPPLPTVPTVAVDKAREVDEVPQAPTLPGCATQMRLQQRFIFDPTDDADVLRINREMLECRVPYRIQVRRFEFADDHKGLPYKSEAAYPSFQTSTAGEKIYGLVYRRPLPYTIQVERYYAPDAGSAVTQLDYAAGCSFAAGDPAPAAAAEQPANRLPPTPQVVCPQAGSGWTSGLEEDQSKLSEFLYAKLAPHFEIEDGKLAVLPNRGPLGIVPFEASSFVTTDYKVEFSEGMPVKWTADRPSMIAAIFRVPVAMLKAIVSVPADLIKLRVDLISDSADEAQAKVQLLCAQQLLAAVDDPAKKEEISELCVQ
ncbi:MAG: hypothetical protein Kow00114_40010 [Kiloniellaceae bacterium]